jgi:outer membrane protein TolC
MGTIALISALLAQCAGSVGAEPVSLTLHRAIEIAQTQSPRAALARDRFRAAYWERRTQRATFLPTLSLRAIAPDFTRSISKLSLPDGSEAFIPQSFVSSSMYLTVGKTLQTTGGELFIESSLQRLDLLSGESSTSYLSSPIGIGLRQSLFTFNPYKWQERIEPLRYEEARRDYVEELEAIAISASQAYFDLLAASDQLATARANYASTDTLFRLARDRPNKRKINEDDLLQAELAFLNTRLEVQRAELDELTKGYALRSLLAMRQDGELAPEVDFQVPEINVDVQVAITQARAHRSHALSFERRRLEAEREIAQARASGRWNLDLYATYGVSQTTEDLGSFFHGQDHEQVSLALQVPILDWGRARARRKVAESNRSVTLLSIDQERADLDQDVTIKALQLKMQGERSQLAAKADEIAQKRFEAKMREYVSGHGNMTDVNRALTEKDAMRQRHVEALRSFWIAYYDLRKATLFDFVTNEPIAVRDLDW